MKGLNLFGGLRKGQMNIPGPVLAGIGIIFGLFVIGIFVYAYALAGGEMGNTAGKSSCTGYWNSTSKVCQASSTNATAIDYNSAAVDVINSTVEGAQAFANFSPTLWIMAAIGVLIGILFVSVGGYFLFANRR